jgi:hypothetical protein
MPSRKGGTWQTKPPVGGSPQATLASGAKQQARVERIGVETRSRELMYDRVAKQAAQSGRSRSTISAQKPRHSEDSTTPSLPADSLNRAGAAADAGRAGDPAPPGRAGTRQG